MAIAVEEIPNEDTVNRLVDFPHKYEPVRGLIWTGIFEFPDNEHESVVWSKYAANDAAVHAVGLGLEAAKKARKPNVRYIGFLPYIAGAIRGFRSARGHGFTVAHLPEEDAAYHAGVMYRPAEGTALGALTKNDKKELKLALQKLAGEMVNAPGA